MTLIPYTFIVGASYQWIMGPFYYPGEPDAGENQIINTNNISEVIDYTVNQTGTVQVTVNAPTPLLINCYTGYFIANSTSYSYVQNSSGRGMGYLQILVKPFNLPLIFPTGSYSTTN